MLLGIGVCALASAQGYFTVAEKQVIADYWAQPNRYLAGPLPDAATHGAWRARPTPEGSVWLHKYYKTRTGNAKVIPGQPPAPVTERQKVWDAWIDLRYNRDVYLATLEAREKSAQDSGTPPSGEPPKFAADPGPIPADLAELVGEPPTFSRAVQPKSHVINFHDGRTLAYTCNIATRPKYAYFRFTEGVMSGGTRVRQLPKAELDNLLRLAGISDSEAKVFAAVSLLEGGFDSLNTYDTGFVSVGFIQFASLTAGAGSLGQVLLRHKTVNPTEFQRDFRQFGLDVSPIGQLVALDLATGIEAVGPDANAVIIRDKRLASVFQRAGQISTPFRVCQLQIAKEAYYPANIPLSVKVGDRTFTGKVSDVFRTEAGLATLMDRKVNTGKLGDLEQRLAQLIEFYGFQSLREASLAEYQLVRMLRYREDYMEELSLTRPRDLSTELSRRGTRSGNRTPPPKP